MSLIRPRVREGRQFVINVLNATSVSRVTAKERGWGKEKGRRIQMEAPELANGWMRSERRYSYEYIKVWEGGSNPDDTSRVQRYLKEKLSIYSQKHLLQNKSAEIQASLCSLFMGAPNIGLLPAAAQHAVCVWKLRACACEIWNGYFAPYAHCWVIFHVFNVV